MLMTGLLRQLLLRWWVLPLLGAVLLAGGGWALWAGAHPSFEQRTGRVLLYTAPEAGGNGSLVLENDPLHKLSLAGDQAGAPPRLLPGSPVHYTVVRGTNEVVALAGITAEDPALAATAAWTSNYLYAPSDYAADHRLLGLLLGALGLVLLATFAYFRFVYAPPSSAGVQREAERLATLDFGPRRVEVSALLRHLAELSDADWQLIGDACYRRRITPGIPPLPMDALRAASRTAGRSRAASRARVAAELLVGQHPPVRDTAGLDLRSVLREPVGVAAAALAVRDLLQEGEFEALYGILGRFIPVTALAHAPDPSTIVALPETPAPA